MSLYRCAACGSPNVVVDTVKDGVNFNYGKAAIGTAIFGAGGAVTGFSSDSRMVFKCPDCGLTLTYSMPQELKVTIDAAVLSAEARNHLAISLKGHTFPISWDMLKQQYKNIESGYADETLKRQSDIQAKNLSSTATATLEEFDTAIDLLVKQYNIDKDNDHYFSCCKAKQMEPDSQRPSPIISLSEYFALQSAVKTVIENISKFIPSSHPTNYRGLDLEHCLSGLFFTYLDELITKQYGFSPEKPWIYYKNCKGQSKYHIMQVETIYYNRFLRSFLDYYKSLLTNGSRESFYVDDLDRYSKLFHQVLLTKNDYYDPHTLPVTVKMHSAVTGHEKIYNLYFPRFTVKNSQLGYWVASFAGGHNTQKLEWCRWFEDDFNSYRTDYFEKHPDEGRAFFSAIDSWNQQIIEYNDLKTKVGESQKAIDDADIKINEYQAEIARLQGKIFGKAKAQERISLLQEKIDDCSNAKSHAINDIKRYETNIINVKYSKNYNGLIAADGDVFLSALQNCHGLIDWIGLDN